MSMFTTVKKTDLHRQKKRNKMKKFKLIKCVYAGRYMSNNKQPLLYSKLDIYLPARRYMYIHALK